MAQAIEPVPVRRDRASRTDCPANRSVQARMEKLAAVKRCEAAVPVSRRGRACDIKMRSKGGMQSIEITGMSGGSLEV